MGASDHTDVLYVDDSSQIAAVSAYVAEEHGDMQVVGEESRAAARERVKRDSFDCIVVELKFATAVSDVCGETPLVLFTETDPTAISDDLLSTADTLVQKGEETQVEFLVEKIRGIARPDDGTEDRTERITAEVPDARTEFYVLDATGAVEWATTPPGEFFPAAVDGDGTTDFHATLFGAATGRYDYRDALAEAVATDSAAERVGLAVPRDGPPTEAPTATYTCWSYPLDDGDRRLEAYREETATIEQSERLARLEQLVELARDGLYMLDADARYAFVTDRYAEMLGYDREELLGRHASSVMSKGALKRGQRAVESLLADPERNSTVVDQVHQTRDGEEVQLSIHFTVVTDEEGSYDGLMGVARDVTERREREQELAEYKTVFETVFDRVYVLDGDSTIRMANQPFASLLGATAEEVEGRDAENVFGLEAHAEIQQVVDRLQRSPKAHGAAEFTLEDDSGTQRPCETHVSLLPDDHEGGCVGVVRDISQRVQREQQVTVLDRVLRHNLRNDLTVVLGQAELLADSVEDDRDREMLSTIQRRCERLMKFAEKARRAQRVLDTAFKQNASETPISDLVRRVTGRISESHDHATVALGVDEVVDASVPTTLHIALTDLVKNAVEHNDREQPWVELSVTQSDGALRIAIADDGPGIPQNELDVLTDGTETPLKHGSGIGFWLVHWIVTQSGGTLSAEERSPRGSIVQIELPVASGRVLSDKTDI